jgi:Lon-like protease
MQSLDRGTPSARSALFVLGLVVFFVPGLVLAGYMLPSPVALVAPGPVEPVASLIRIEGSSYESDGRLYVTTVRVATQPRIGQYLLARLQTDVEIVSKSDVISPLLNLDEFQKLSQRLLEESKSISEVVALRQAGFDVPLNQAHVQVVTTTGGSSAKLQPGDIIEAIDGEEIETTCELVSIVHDRLTGEPLSLRIRRADQWLTVTVPTVRGPVDTEGPVLGVLAVTNGLDYHTPLDIKIESGQASGGPSAGLMYALGVYNALVTEDITHGRSIAGTGTLRLNGAVGSVGGISLKVRAAEGAGAEYFLVPDADAVAARSAAREIKILPVHTFQDALDALHRIGEEGERGPRIVPASGDTTLACLNR